MKNITQILTIIILIVLSAILYIEYNASNLISQRIYSLESRTDDLMAIMNDSSLNYSNQKTAFDTNQKISFIVESNSRNIIAIKSAKILWNVNPIVKFKDIASVGVYVDSISLKYSSDRFYVWWSNGLYASINKMTGESIVFYDYWYKKEKTFLKLINKKALDLSLEVQLLWYAEIA